MKDGNLTILYTKETRESLACSLLGRGEHAAEFGPVLRPTQLAARRP